MDKKRLKRIAEQSNLGLPIKDLEKMISLLSKKGYHFKYKNKNLKPNKFVAWGFRFSVKDRRVHMYTMYPPTGEVYDWGVHHDFDFLFIDIDWEPYGIKL